MNNFLGFTEKKTYSQLSSKHFFKLLKLDIIITLPERIIYINVSYVNLLCILKLILILLFVGPQVQMLTSARRVNTARWEPQIRYSAPWVPMATRQG